MMLSRVVRNSLNNLPKACYSTEPVGPPKNVLIEQTIKSHEKYTNGIIHDKKPIKVLLKADKTYWWCLCGHSSNQPYCNGSHLNIFKWIKQRPLKFRVPETKEYSLCVCKQTNNRPFCDGAHRKPEVQQAKSVVEQKQEKNK
ncbi:CDGSH iron-sulfur domain-containing protein 3, mitochondrial-like [Diorhabda sublineata]|uniref:CDGSH iron-sulfur domain-containing protein 3, mitochondrial-like n=1 Tax=Diorhabda sublineata TaxID=1163346 RepID=UPI0024E0EB68|nr:CDGSH iron-sulfur domain-containing protein 3, mitochondrial-like [Diorhabda sublineata]XP_056639923.1 CDGSH iron-sulfur domain-containing protein 3, mitochondrial-like [Diorhabda sublineata]XP_056639924.1 CDGSH iron-sulfur domain-containing protein 3, mitochondrial-like [Diorhabda sublineata]